MISILYLNPKPQLRSLKFEQSFPKNTKQESSIVKLSRREGLGFNSRLIIIKSNNLLKLTPLP